MDENRIADRGRFWRRWAKSTLARNGKMLSTGSLTIWVTKILNPTLITVMVDELEQFGISHRISGNSGNINLAQSGSYSIISGIVGRQPLSCGNLMQEALSCAVIVARQAVQAGRN
jgi:hypothetical protein